MNDYYGIPQGESSLWGKAVFYQRDMDESDTTVPNVDFRIRIYNFLPEDEMYDVMLFDEIETGSTDILVEETCPTWFESGAYDSEHNFGEMLVNHNNNGMVRGIMPFSYSLRDDRAERTGLVGKHVVIMNGSEVVDCCTLEALGTV